MLLEDISISLLALGMLSLKTKPNAVQILQLINQTKRLNRNLRSNLEKVKVM